MWNPERASCNRQIFPFFPFSPRVMDILGHWDSFEEGMWLWMEIRLRPIHTRQCPTGCLGWVGGFRVLGQAGLRNVASLLRELQLGVHYVSERGTSTWAARPWPAAQRERARAIERAKMRGTAGGAVGCFMDLISRARVGIALPCCAGVFRQ